MNNTIRFKMGLTALLIIVFLIDLLRVYVKSDITDGLVFGALNGGGFCMVVLCRMVLPFKITSLIVIVFYLVQLLVVMRLVK